MRIDSTFSVVAPIDKVWDTLMDFERVAGCVPGAQILNKLSDDAYQVGMKVKLGPVTMQYRGQLTVLERDAAGHRAVLQGRAQETRGQGTAEATVTLSLAEAQGATQGTVSADVALSGKVAAMGKSVIGGVTEQMMGLFATNLQALLAEPSAEAAEAGAGSAAAQASAPVPAVAATEPQPVPARAAQAPAPAVAAGQLPASAPDTSLNALALARGMISDQLSHPAKLLGLLAAVAACAYLQGRRAGLRSARLRAAGLRTGRARTGRA